MRVLDTSALSVVPLMPVLELSTEPSGRNARFLFLGPFDSALPFDVRRWLCLAAMRLSHLGLCPWFGL